MPRRCRLTRDNQMQKNMQTHAGRILSWRLTRTKILIRWAIPALCQCWNLVWNAKSGLTIYRMKFLKWLGCDLLSLSSSATQLRDVQCRYAECARRGQFRGLVITLSEWIGVLAGRGVAQKTNGTGGARLAVPWGRTDNPAVSLPAEFYHISPTPDNPQIFLPQLLANSQS